MFTDTDSFLALQNIFWGACIHIVLAVTHTLHTASTGTLSVCAIILWKCMVRTQLITNQLIATKYSCLLNHARYTHIQIS